MGTTSFRCGHRSLVAIGRERCQCAKRAGEVGRVGYEINFNRYFYKYVPPRPLEEIDAELKQLETEIAALLSQVTV